MKIILYVVGWAAVITAASAAFMVHPSPSQSPKEPLAIKAVVPGQEPWADAERKLERVRINAREWALRALGQSSSSFCSDGGRKVLTAALNNYYGHRSAQARGYADNWGEAGAQHIAKVWAGADDNRIEQLTLGAYRHGYLNPDQLNPGPRIVIGELLRGESPASNPCTA